MGLVFLFRGFLKGDFTGCLGLFRGELGKITGGNGENYAEQITTNLNIPMEYQAYSIKAYSIKAYSISRFSSASCSLCKT